MVSEQPERFFVAEIVREKIFLLYEREIPYSCQVQIREFKERKSENKAYISASILVERDSQKGVLIGKGGAALKRLGQAARKDIETFLEREVSITSSMMADVVHAWLQGFIQMARHLCHGTSAVSACRKCCPACVNVCWMQHAVNAIGSTSAILQHHA
eukprot:366555-Chlamydomonas_euryale.AAC.19